MPLEEQFESTNMVPEQAQSFQVSAQPLPPPTPLSAAIAEPALQSLAGETQIVAERAAKERAIRAELEKPWAIPQKPGMAQQQQTTPEDVGQIATEARTKTYGLESPVEESAGTVGALLKGGAHGARDWLADKMDTLDWLSDLASQKLGMEKGGIFRKLSDSIKPDDFNRDPDSFAYQLGAALGQGAGQVAELAFFYSKIFAGIKGAAGLARIRDIPGLLKAPGVTSSGIKVREAIRKTGQAVGAAAEYAAQKPGVVGKILETPLKSVATLGAFGLPEVIKEADRGDKGFGETLGAVGKHLALGTGMAAGFNVINSLKWYKKALAGGAGFGAMAGLEGADAKNIAANAVTGAIFALLGHKEKELRTDILPKEASQAALENGLNMRNDPESMIDIVKSMERVWGGSLAPEKSSRVDPVTGEKLKPLEAGIDPNKGPYGDFTPWKNIYRSQFGENPQKFTRWMYQTLDNITEGQGNDPLVRQYARNLIWEITGGKAGKPYIVPAEVRSAAKPTSSDIALEKGSKLTFEQARAKLEASQKLEAKIDAELLKPKAERNTKELLTLQEQAHNLKEQAQAYLFAKSRDKGIVSDFTKFNPTPENMNKIFGIEFPENKFGEPATPAKKGTAPTKEPTTKEKPIAEPAKKEGVLSEIVKKDMEKASKLPKEDLKITPAERAEAKRRIEEAKKAAKKPEDMTTEELADLVRAETPEKSTEKGKTKPAKEEPKKAAKTPTEDALLQDRGFDKETVKAFNSDKGLKRMILMQELSPKDIAVSKEGVILPKSEAAAKLFDAMAVGAKDDAASIGAARIIQALETELTGKPGEIKKDLIKLAKREKIKLDKDTLELVTSWITDQNAWKETTRTSKTPGAKEVAGAKKAFDDQKKIEAAQKPVPKSPLEMEIGESQKFLDQISKKIASGIPPERVNTIKQYLLSLRSELEAALAGGSAEITRDKRATKALSLLGEKLRLAEDNKKLNKDKKIVPIGLKEKQAIIDSTTRKINKQLDRMGALSGLRNPEYWAQLGEGEVPTGFVPEGLPTKGDTVAQRRARLKKQAQEGQLKLSAKQIDRLVKQRLADQKATYRDLTEREAESVTGIISRISELSTELARLSTGDLSLPKMKMGGIEAAKRAIAEAGVNPKSAAARDIMERYSATVGTIETAGTTLPEGGPTYQLKKGPGAPITGDLTRARLAQEAVGGRGFQVKTEWRSPIGGEKASGARRTGYRRSTVILERTNPDQFTIKLVGDVLGGTHRAALMKEADTLRIAIDKLRTAERKKQALKDYKMGSEVMAGEADVLPGLEETSIQRKTRPTSKKAAVLQKRLDTINAELKSTTEGTFGRVQASGKLERKPVPGKKGEFLWQFRWPRWGESEQTFDVRKGKMLAEAEIPKKERDIRRNLLNREIELEKLSKNPEKYAERIEKVKNTIAGYQKALEKDLRTDLWDELPYEQTVRLAEMQLKPMLEARGLGRNPKTGVGEEIVPSIIDPLSVERGPIDKNKIIEINEPYKGRSGWKEGFTYRGKVIGVPTEIQAQTIERHAKGLAAKGLAPHGERSEPELKTRAEMKAELEGEARRLGIRESEIPSFVSARMRFTHPEFEGMEDIGRGVAISSQEAAGHRLEKLARKTGEYGLLDPIEADRRAMNRLDTLRMNVAAGQEEIIGLKDAVEPPLVEKRLGLQERLNADVERLMKTVEMISGERPPDPQSALDRSQAILEGFEHKAATAGKSSQANKGLFEAQDVAHTRQVGGPLEEAQRRVSDQARSIYAALATAKGEVKSRLERTRTIKDFTDYNDVRMNEKERAKLLAGDPMEIEKSFMPITDMLSQPTQSKIEDVRNLGKSIVAERTAAEHQKDVLIRNPDSLINQIQGELNKSNIPKASEVMADHLIRGTEPTNPYMKKAIDMWKKFADSVADVTDLKKLRIYVNNYFPLIPDLESTYHKMRARWQNYTWENLPNRYKLGMDVDQFNEIKAIMKDKQYWDLPEQKGQSLNQVQRELVQKRVYDWDGIFTKWEHLSSMAQDRQLLNKDKFNMHLQQRSEGVDYLQYKHDAIEVMKQYITTMIRNQMAKNIIEQNAETINKWPYAKSTGSVRWFMEKQIKAALGHQTAMEKWIESMIDRANKAQELVVLDSRYGKELADRLVGATAKGVLGVDTAIRNLTQQINTIVDKGPYLYVKGLKSYVQNGLGEHQKMWDALGLGREAFEGDSARMKLGEALAKEAGGWNKFMAFYDWLGNAALSPLRMTEHVNKAVTFLTALEEAKARGMSFEGGVRMGLKNISNMVPNLVIPEAYQKAYYDTLRTQYGYGVGHKSPLLRGPLARMSTIFWSYPANTIQFINRGLVDSWKAGDNARFLRFLGYLGFQLGAASAIGLLGYDVASLFGVGILPAKPMSLPWEILYNSYNAIAAPTEVDRQKAVDGVTNAFGAVLVPQYRWGKKMINNFQNIMRGARVGGPKELEYMETNPVTEIFDMVGAKPIEPSLSWELMRQMQDAGFTQGRAKQKYILEASKYAKDGNFSEVRSVVEKARKEGIPISYGDVQDTVRLQQQKTLLEQRLKSVPKNLRPEFERRIKELQGQTMPSKRPAGGRSMWSSEEED